MTVTVKYTDYPGVTPATKNFDIVVSEDPCAAATITFNNLPGTVVVPVTEVTYTIGETSDVQTFDLTKISQSLVGITCPAFTVALFDDDNGQEI